jgi:hypothetical protein
MGQCSPAEAIAAGAGIGRTVAEIHGSMWRDAGAALKRHAAIFSIALALRLLHNGYAMESPLYLFPLGGHVPYLVLAERIAGGELVPFDGPITLNSPLHPYVLALVYRIVGVWELHLVRLTGILLDSLTCVLIASLARGCFGPAAGWIAGLLSAGYGPMVFYAAELMEVPYVLFLLTAAVWVLQRTDRLPGYAGAGVLLGLGVCLRPNLLLVAAALVGAPTLLGRSRAAAKSAVLAVALLVSIAPISLINYLASGRWVLLTASGGHNFYLGHRRGATAGYTLPESLDGDIFASMKTLAEKVEGRPIADHEVSGYYVRKALRHIRADPLGELRLAARKLEAAANDHEASTYVCYEFQRATSPMLAHMAGFGTLFPLAVVGMLAHRRCVLLLVPVLATFLTIVLFFYIARLRMPMVPFLIVFASAALVDLWRDLRGRRWQRIAGTVAVLAVTGIASNRRLVPVDVSDEWNKTGVVLRLQERYADAEEAFLAARAANPRNPNTYRNLGVLYEKLGRTEEAAQMRRVAESVSDPHEEDRFADDLRL